ncbi:sel1 repeat family protein [Endozoicomonas sp. SM1973]|uniref:Sel1 repeat family protein n=1 Tax=Spartinivicinus marinus TaxID=2994442 RepID=A0A853IHX9_9GAMM|nr:tetratricopeptide repeat protein [Spartinivicinus marinus]MCX4030520.1 tetratricopeptide repeat protein [Spartinivicinus marinus]NYZ69661.1 sel1 repeat family protein [Spartinivicinus marinus]
MDNDTLFQKADELHEKGDFKSAFHMFLKAAENGDSSCMLRVALMYSCGEGVECDYDKAEEWELKAVDCGDISGMKNLGITYRIKGDIRKSKEWFEKALKAGDGSAALELAKLYMVSEKETKTVMKYLQIAISSKNMCESDIEEAEDLLSQFT